MLDGSRPLPSCSRGSPSWSTGDMTPPVSASTTAQRSRWPRSRDGSKISSTSPEAALRSRALPASDTPAGLPTALPPTRTATPICPTGANFRWCTTASSKTTSHSKRCSRKRACNFTLRRTPRWWQTSSNTFIQKALPSARPCARLWRGWRAATPLAYCARTFPAPSSASRRTVP